jgi:hypothetical protein
MDMAYYAVAVFSRPPGPEIPACRTLVTGGWPVISAARPTCEPRGLSVFQTLHLVADIQKAYNIF